MQASELGFEATNIEERYSRQRKEQNYKQEKSKKRRCVWIEVIIFFWNSMSLRGSSARQKPDLSIFISL